MHTFCDTGSSKDNKKPWKETFLISETSSNMNFENVRINNDEHIYICPHFGLHTLSRFGRDGLGSIFRFRYAFEKYVRRTTKLVIDEGLKIYAYASEIADRQNTESLPTQT